MDPAAPHTRAACGAAFAQCARYPGAKLQAQAEQLTRRAVTARTAAGRVVIDAP